MSQAIWSTYEIALLFLGISLQRRSFQWYQDHSKRTY